MERNDISCTLVLKVPTWQVVKGLMLQSNCGTSWMDTWRLNAVPLNSMVLGSSSSRPPLLCSPTATSWRQTGGGGGGGGGEGLARTSTETLLYV